MRREAARDLITPVVWACIFGWFIVTTVFMIACVLGLAGCKPITVETLTPANKQEILDYAGKLHACEDEGRAAHNYKVYDDCKTREKLQ